MFYAQLIVAYRAHDQQLVAFSMAKQPIQPGQPGKTNQKAPKPGLENLGIGFVPR